MTSDNRVFENINKTTRMKKLEQKLKRVQRSLSRKYEYYKKGGNAVTGLRRNLNKQVLQVQKLHQRLAAIRHAYQDYVIWQLVKTIVYYSRAFEYKRHDEEQTYDPVYSQTILVSIQNTESNCGKWTPGILPVNCVHAAGKRRLPCPFQNAYSVVSVDSKWIEM
jgi:hypothetical protein